MSLGKHKVGGAVLLRRGGSSIKRSRSVARAVGGFRKPLEKKGENMLERGGNRYPSSNDTKCCKRGSIQRD